jgi:hypothetical protein
MSSAGFTRPGLKCDHCGLPFALSLGAGVIGSREVEKLPDPFQAKCPLCEHEATYPKSSISVLVAVAGQ